MDRQQHWENVYRTRRSDEVGWYRPHLEVSLEWIELLSLASATPIIDVGGGASTFVDDLLDAGFTDVTVLDIAAPALEQTKRRLGKRAKSVTWLGGDVATIELPENAYGLWHDRAVFHFLTDDADRRAYRRNLLHALRPGGYLLIGTFSPEAPPTCSGLPVMRYDRENLVDLLGAPFALERHDKSLHVTPGGVEQMYSHCLFRHKAEEGA